MKAQLGRAKKGCSGFGICNITVSTGDALLDAGGTMSFTERQAQGKSYYEFSGFNITRISDELAREHFVIRDSMWWGYIIEENLQTELKINGKSSPVLVKSGKYKVQKTKKGYYIGTE